ncbi:unnamed protein product [Amoebophrya sp. A120]|nr:unnamed protein product [Amoebophrya sp. A120]|eukprot:GSA120T00016900001.1
MYNSMLYSNSCGGPVLLLLVISLGQFVLPARSSVWKRVSLSPDLLPASSTSQHATPTPPPDLLSRTVVTVPEVVTETVATCGHSTFAACRESEDSSSSSSTTTSSILFWRPGFAESKVLTDFFQHVAGDDRTSPSSISWSELWLFPLLKQHQEETRWLLLNYLGRRGKGDEDDPRGLQTARDPTASLVNIQKCANKAEEDRVRDDDELGQNRIPEQHDESYHQHAQNYKPRSLSASSMTTSASSSWFDPGAPPGRSSSSAAPSEAFSSPPHKNLLKWLQLEGVEDEDNMDNDEEEAQRKIFPGRAVEREETAAVPVVEHQELSWEEERQLDNLRVVPILLRDASILDDRDEAQDDHAPVVDADVDGKELTTSSGAASLPPLQATTLAKVADFLALDMKKCNEWIILNVARELLSSTVREDKKEDDARTRSTPPAGSRSRGAATSTEVSSLAVSETAIKSLVNNFLLDRPTRKRLWRWFASEVFWNMDFDNADDDESDQKVKDHVGAADGGNRSDHAASQTTLKLLRHEIFNVDADPDAHPAGKEKVEHEEDKEALNKRREDYIADARAWILREWRETIDELLLPWLDPDARETWTQNFSVVAGGGSTRTTTRTVETEAEADRPPSCQVDDSSLASGSDLEPNRNTRNAHKNDLKEQEVRRLPRHNNNAPTMRHFELYYDRICQLLTWLSNPIHRALPDFDEALDAWEDDRNHFRHILTGVTPATAAIQEPPAPQRVVASLAAATGTGGREGISNATTTRPSASTGGAAPSTGAPTTSPPSNQPAPKSRNTVMITSAALQRLRPQIIDTIPARKTLQILTELFQGSLHGDPTGIATQIATFIWRAGRFFTDHLAAPGRKSYVEQMQSQRDHDVSSADEEEMELSRAGIANLSVSRGGPTSVPARSAEDGEMLNGNGAALLLQHPEAMTFEAQQRYHMSTSRRAQERAPALFRPDEQNTGWTRTKQSLFFPQRRRGDWARTADPGDVARGSALRTPTTAKNPSSIYATSYRPSTLQELAFRLYTRALATQNIQAEFQEILKDLERTENFADRERLVAYAHNVEWITYGGTAVAIPRRSGRAPSPSAALRNASGAAAHNTDFDEGQHEDRDHDGIGFEMKQDLLYFSERHPRRVFQLVIKELSERNYRLSPYWQSVFGMLRAAGTISGTTRGGPSLLDHVDITAHSHINQKLSSHSQAQNMEEREQSSNGPAATVFTEHRDTNMRHGRAASASSSTVGVAPASSSDDLRLHSGDGRRDSVQDEMSADLHAASSSSCSSVPLDDSCSSPSASSTTPARSFNFLQAFPALQLRLRRLWSSET